jgi:hypothetical protein
MSKETPDQPSRDPEQEAYNKKSDEAHATWQKNGRLGVTADDHSYIGGSPPFELSKNPGKTEGELLSVAELKKKLDGWVSFLDENKEKLKKGIDDFVEKQMAEDNISWAKNQLTLAVPYLESIGKLPPEFKDYKVEDLPADPQ